MRLRISKRRSGGLLTPRQKKELAALAALPDDQIDTSVVPELPPGGVERCGARQVLSPCKTSGFHAARRRRRRLAKEARQRIPDPGEQYLATTHVGGLQAGLKRGNCISHT